MSNGEEIVVRAAMKPLPTLMQPLPRSTSRRGEPAQALVERSDVSAVEALAVVAEAAVAWELARLREGQVRRRRARRLRRRLARVRRADRLDRALTKHVALIGFMGAGKTTLGERGVRARLNRHASSTSTRSSRRRRSASIPSSSPQARTCFREVEEEIVCERASNASAPRVVALGGGAVIDAAGARCSARPRDHRLARRGRRHVLGARPGTDRPLAQDEAAFRRLYDERRPLYAAAADAVVRDADDVVLAAAGVHVERGALQRLGELVPGDGKVALVSRLQRRRHPRHGRAARARRAPRAGARAAAGRGREDDRRARPALAGPAARPPRDGRRARRRLHDRRRRLRRRDVPSRRRLGAGADEPRRAGRRGDRRQDRHRPAAGQEPRRRVPLARRAR